MKTSRSRLALAGHRSVVAGAAAALLAGAVVAPVSNAQDLSTTLVNTLSQFAGSASTAQESGPQIEVSKTTISEDGEHEVTVTGTGFKDDTVLGARPPLAGKGAGAYVVFGKFADKWKPSEGAPMSARTSISEKWAVAAADFDLIGGPEKGAIEMRPDGSFSTTFTVSKALVEATLGNDDGNLGIYTYAGSGAKHGPWELYQPITFGEPAAGGSGSLGSLTGLLPL